jgi:hypothetical protein
MLLLHAVMLVTPPAILARRKWMKFGPAILLWSILLLVTPLCLAPVRAWFTDRGNQVPALILGQDSWLTRGFQEHLGWGLGKPHRDRTKTKKHSPDGEPPEEPPRVPLGAEVASKIEVDIVEVKGDDFIFQIYNGNDDCYADIITIEFRSPDGKAARKLWQYYISPLDSGPGQFQVGAVAGHPIEGVEIEVLAVEGRTVKVVEKAREEFDTWKGLEDEPKPPQVQHLDSEQLQKLEVKTERERNSVRLDIRNHLEKLTVTELILLVPSPSGGQRRYKKKVELAPHDNIRSILIPVPLLTSEESSRIEILSADASDSETYAKYQTELQDWHAGRLSGKRDRESR